MKKLFYFFLLFLFSCSQEKRLPYLGFHEDNPDKPGDTIYHSVPEFYFLNQDGKIISHEDYKGKIYVANFFFTSCPSICPKMISQMKRLQAETKDSDIYFLSHTVDPRRDSVETLRRYCEKNAIDTKNWNFVTGDKEIIYDLGMTGYGLSMMEDEEADGGFLHSEMIVLVDKSFHLRGMYDGTNTEAVNKLIEDLKILQNEYK